MATRQGRKAPAKQPGKRKAPGKQPGKHKASGKQPAKRKPSGKQPAKRKPSGKQPAKRKPPGRQPAKSKRRKRKDVTPSPEDDERKLQEVMFWRTWKSCAFPRLLDPTTVLAQVSHLCGALYAPNSTCLPSRQKLQLPVNEILNNILGLKAGPIATLVCHYLLDPDPCYFYDSYTNGEGKTCILYARGPCLPSHPALRTTTTTPGFECLCNYGAENQRVADLVMVTNFPVKFGCVERVGLLPTGSEFSIYVTPWIALNLETNEVTATLPTMRKGMTISLDVFAAHNIQSYTFAPVNGGTRNKADELFIEQLKKENPHMTEPGARLLSKQGKRTKKAKKN